MALDKAQFDALLDSSLQTSKITEVCFPSPRIKYLANNETETWWAVKVCLEGGSYRETPAYATEAEADQAKGDIDVYLASLA